MMYPRTDAEAKAAETWAKDFLEKLDKIREVYRKEGKEAGEIACFEAARYLLMALFRLVQDEEAMNFATDFNAHRAGYHTGYQHGKDDANG